MRVGAHGRCTGVRLTIPGSRVMADDASIAFPPLHADGKEGERLWLGNGFCQAEGGGLPTAAAMPFPTAAAMSLPQGGGLPTAAAAMSLPQGGGLPTAAAPQQASPQFFWHHSGVQQRQVSWGEILRSAVPIPAPFGSAEGCLPPSRAAQTSATAAPTRPRDAPNFSPSRSGHGRTAAAAAIPLPQCTARAAPTHMQGCAAELGGDVPIPPPSRAAQPSCGGVAQNNLAATAGTRKRQAAQEGVRAKVLRSPEAAMAESSTLAQAPVGFPMGPIVGTVPAMQSRVNLHTQNVKTGGGGFGVCRTREVKQCKLKGDIVRLHCYKHKQGCGWSTKWEETNQGWILVDYKAHAEAPKDANGQPLLHARRVPTENEHSHELMHDEAQVLSSLSHHVSSVLHQHVFYNVRVRMSVVRMCVVPFLTLSERYKAL